MNQESYLEVERMIPDGSGGLIPNYTWRHYLKLTAHDWLVMATEEKE